METIKTKKTSDIYFASALSALGAKLESIDKTDPRHMVFEFSSPESSSDAIPKFAVLDLDYIERGWLNKVLPVNAPEYAEAIKRMKSIVHSD